MRRGWHRRLGSVHCCSFHFVAPFFFLSYFTMGSSAGRSPFRVVPPLESPLCPCLGQLVCLSISPALLALLSWHHFCFSLTRDLVSLLPWHCLLSLLCFSASLVLWHVSCISCWVSVLSMFAACFYVYVFEEVLCAPLVLFWCAMGPFCPLLSWLEPTVTRTMQSMTTSYTSHHCSTLATKALLVMLKTSE